MALPDGPSPWQLPAATRTLAKRFDVEIVQATGRALATADSKYSEHLTVSRSKLEDRLDSQKASFQATRATAESHSKTLESVAQQLRKHLGRQNILAREPEGPPDRNTGSVARPVAAMEDLSAAGVLVGRMHETVTQSILPRSKPTNPLVPNAKAARWALLIAALVVGILFGNVFQSFGGFLTGASLVYVGVMFALHYLPGSMTANSVSEVLRMEDRVRRLIDRGLKTAAAEDVKIREEAMSEARADEEAAEIALQAALGGIKDSVTTKLRQFHEEFSEFYRQTGFAGAEWGDSQWKDWASSSLTVFATSLGKWFAQAEDLEHRFPELDWHFELPALVPFSDNKCLLLKGTGNQKDQLAGAAQAALSRLLATIPPGKARFTFVDPVGLGQNVAQFMPLADFEESLITSRAWTEPSHIEQRLNDLTEHMETVIQKYLRTDFQTIQEYNEAAKEVAEPYRFLAVFDFPVNFSETAARRLISIARNGGRCGVYALVVCDSAKPMPYGFTFAELEQAASVVSGRGEAGVEPSESHNPDQPDPKSAAKRTARPQQDISARSPNPISHFGWDRAMSNNWRLILDPPPPKEILDRIIRATGDQAKGAMRVEVPYEKLLSLANLGSENCWKASTADSLRVPLGPTGARKLQYLSLGEEGTGHHALIVGRTGSGKSNLMHVIITTLALTYSPDELRVYLIDFKKGVEFKCYADYKLPHAEAIAIESEREFAYSVIERLNREMSLRGDSFNAVGVQKISQYRAAKPDIPLPRILLIVDEFQEFFSQDDQIARQTALILDRLVRQGRGFGIHILLGSQTLAGSYNLGKSTLDQMAIRIAMQCSEADSRLILSDDNPAARLLSRPGEAIYNAASGLVEGNNLFQVARFSEEDKEKSLGLVHRVAKDSGKKIPAPVVFQGNELAQLTECRKLQALLSETTWPAKRNLELLLGEPIAIRDPIAARLRRQSGNNLLILSRDESEGVGMCVASMVSLLAQQRPEIVRLFIADFTLADSEWAERAEEIAEFFPHETQVLSRQKELAGAVKDVAAEVTRRAADGKTESSVFLVLQGLQRMKVLREDEDWSTQEGGMTPPNELLSLILREGPEVGVHVIAWCDTYSNASRVFDGKAMREFGLRAGAVMNADDSHRFLDDAAASKIDRPHRVLFLDEERPGQLDKFRPYSMPSRDWLQATGRKLKERLK
jgi:DNA segregation ATPase FtsK/SpoIIIE, S-DNA-T family